MARPTLEKAKQQAADLKAGMTFDQWLKKWGLSKQGAWAKTSRLKKIGLLPLNFTTRQTTKPTPVGKSTVASMVKEDQRGQRGQRVQMDKRVQRVQMVKTVHLVLPADLWKQVSKAAIDQETTKVAIVKEALKKYFKT